MQIQNAVKQLLNEKKDISEYATGNKKVIYTVAQKCRTTKRKPWRKMPKQMNGVNIAVESRRLCNL